MAWRSGGTTNDEMVTNLKRFGVISSDHIEQGFRNVDRLLFVPKGQEYAAHSDKPLKEGNVHISAPHIYGSALEALELRPNSSLSFLNVGSGTGYVSCIVADILGPRSTHYGVEIHQDVVQHCREAMDAWKRNRTNVPPIHILVGNAHDVVHTRGEALVGFDRIYVGAAVERRNLSKLTRLLRPGGILVGPVDDELVKVVRVGSNSGEARATDFSQQVLSGVRFAPLLYFPRKEIVIPSTVWNPSIHHSYPDSFRASCRELLLCSNTTVHQSEQRVNLAAMLPNLVWIEILSYTHRTWFEPEQSETAFLRQRLAEERADAQRAHEARREAEMRCHAAERERDVYRALARRWQSRLQELRRQLSSNEQEEQQHELLSGREQSVIYGLGNMLRRFQNDEEEEEDSDMEEDDDFVVDMLAESHSNDSDEDNHEEEYDSDGSARRASRQSLRSDSVSMDDADDSEMVVSPTNTKAIASRPQVRTVSISSDDL